MKELTEIHPIRKAELDRMELREKFKTRFTVLAKFEGVDPCNRCEDPYCINNLPHYEQWDNLIRCAKKAAAIIKDQYPKQVFEIITLDIYADWETWVNALRDFIQHHNYNLSQLTPPQRMGDKEG